MATNSIFIAPIVSTPSSGILSTAAQGGTPWPTIAKWMLGLGGTWIVLSFMVDLEDTADLASAFAVVIAGSVLLTHGTQAFKNLGFLS